MKMGVLGGTFDPVHKGHLMIAEEARSQLNLSEVIFVPARQSPLKPNRHMAPVEHRLQMLRLAIAGKPCFKLSTIEIERAGPSYTVDTIVQLRRKIGQGDELFFILGWDSLAELHKWREPSRIIETCYLVAAPRSGCTKPDLNALEIFIPGISERVIFLDKPVVDISASEIRARIAQGLTIGRLVPRPVADYIKEHTLYLTQKEVHRESYRHCW